MGTRHDRIRMMVALRQLPGVGPVTTLEAIRRMPTLPQEPDTLEAELDRIAEGMKRPIRARTTVLAEALWAADRLIEDCRARGIGIAVAGDDGFRLAMWRIKKPPLMLFFRGDAGEATSQGAVAIVGTREPTEYGRRCARKIAGESVRRGRTVVSGLALGCDAAAHEGALEAGGRTIAVVATGLHAIYPPANRGLADAILQGGGMLVSEYPPGVELRSHQLVERDRIQAALSDGLIVIETDVEGGTMHTVEFACEQDRPIACVDHPEAMRTEPQCRGNRMLIDQGVASPLGSTGDLEAFLDRLATPRPTGPEGLFDRS